MTQDKDKSTPRPWRVDLDAIEHDHPGMHPVICNHRKHIADVGNAENWLEAQEEWLANAALIVSAVNQRAALLQCAEAFMEMREKLDWRYPEDAGPEAIRSLTEPWQKVCSALAALSALEQAQK